MDAIMSRKLRYRSAKINIYMLIGTRIIQRDTFFNINFSGNVCDFLENFYKA